MWPDDREPVSRRREYTSAKRGSAPRCREQASQTLPRDVAALVNGALDSVHQLEILLLLANDPGLEWSPDAVGELLSREPESIRADLLVLWGRGLLISWQRLGGPRFSLEPVSRVARAVQHLARIYPACRGLVLDILIERASVAGTTDQ